MIRILYLLVASALWSCSNKPAETASEQPSDQPVVTQASTNTPVFNADSAYQFVQRQVDFGPRVPNTSAHKQCGNYLASELKRFGAQVHEQEMTLTAYDGTALESKNIIGTYNAESEKRILLFAHWDSRPYSDEDPNKENLHKPIDGADDGASGVGVLLEIARQLQQKAPAVGIDIIFFDAEDYGIPDFAEEKYGYKSGTWCLGSRFWGKNPHIKGYKADFGILLDMVGAKDAVFYKEYISMRHAARYVDKVWETARNLGFGKYFINANGGGVTDDHEAVIEETGIPCLDIINYDPQSEKGFRAHWHTQNDNMKNIDKDVLKAVGQTVLEVVYQYQ